MEISELQPADVLLYPVIANSMIGFHALAIGSRIIGIKPEYVHCSMVVKVKSNNEIEECSSYTNGFLDPEPGVQITGRYGPPCVVYRAIGLDKKASIKYLVSRVNALYAWDGIFWLALVRRLGLRNVADRNDRRLLCSSLLGFALQAGGFQVGRYACELAPQDFTDILGLEKIGRLF